MRLIDLTGQTFGRLTVIERAANRGRVTYWRCQCECGRWRTASSQHLRDGRSHFCGTACTEAAGRRPWPRDPRVMVGSDGSIVGRAGRPLTPQANVHGYLVVSIWDGQTWRTRTVHSIVCETFHGLRPEGLLALHNNGDQLDCRAENLRWGTSVDNAADRTAHGNAWRGERHHRAKITENDVRSIRAASASGASRRALAAQYGLSKRAIQFIVQRRNWKHVL